MKVVVTTKILATGLLCLLAAACEQKKPAAVAPPPPKVTVAKPIVRDVTQWDEYIGQLDAVQTVEVKSQVSGFLESVNFTEGALVKEGDVLATIDSRIFRAQLESAQASVLQAQARLEQSRAALQLSQADLARARAAAEKGAVTPSEVETDKAKMAEDQATITENEATIKVAEAAVKSAELNVNWCKITAPISGRISSKNVTPGNMITGGPGQTTRLTTIKSVNPIYCWVNADESSVLKYQKLAMEKRRESAETAPLPCYMELENEKDFPHKGVIDFVDIQINASTATRRARGVFDNPDGSLLPGFFARFRVVGQSYPQALLVIDDAIGVDQDRKYVSIMHTDKTVERRAITAGPLIGELRVVLTGLNKDDLVIVNGNSSLMMVMGRPGATVDGTETPMPEHRLPAAAAAAAAAQATGTTATAPATQSTPRPATATDGNREAGK